MDEMCSMLRTRFRGKTQEKHLYLKVVDNLVKITCDKGLVHLVKIK